MSRARRRWSPAGRASAANAAMTPRSDSLASLLAADDAASAASSSSAAPPSAPRSRKKIKHRSSLEFLGGGNSAAAGDVVAAVLPSSAGRKSGAKRKRISVSSSSLASITQGGSSAVGPKPKKQSKHNRQIMMSPQSKYKLHDSLSRKNHRPPSEAASQHQREMSPQSKSKLMSLVGEIHPKSEIMKEGVTRQGGNVNDAESDSVERARKKVVSKKRLNPELLENRSSAKDKESIRDKEIIARTKNTAGSSKKKYATEIMTTREDNVHKSRLVTHNDRSQKKVISKKRLAPELLENRSSAKTKESIRGKEIIAGAKNIMAEPSKMSTKEEKDLRKSRLARNDGEAFCSSTLRSSEDDHITPKTNRAMRKQQQKQSPTFSDQEEQIDSFEGMYHLTPKTKRPSETQYQQPSPKISDTPLNYRPEKNGFFDDVAAPMLESYLEQWTKPSPDSNRPDRGWKDEASAGDEWQNGEEQSVNSPNISNDRLHEFDDPSSSVISTSSNSDIIDEDEHATGPHEEQQQLVSFGNNGGIPTTQPTKTNETLQLEYGRLAFMKEELEQKLQTNKLEAERVNPWISRSAVMEIPMVATNNQVVLGAEADIVHNHKLFPLEAFGNPNYQLGNHEQEIIAPQIQVPSQEDVAFGEMALKLMTSETQMTHSEKCELGDDQDDSPSCDKSSQKDERSDATKYDRCSQKDDRIRSHRGAPPPTHQRDRRSKIYHNPNREHISERKMSPMQQPSSKPKPKKKRKRRVVETITRVIHEESEEEGSASTRGGRRGHHDYIDSPQRKVVKRYYENDDDSTNYNAKESNAKRPNYSRESNYKYSPDRGGTRLVSHRRRRYEQDSSDEQSFGSSIIDAQKDSDEKSGHNIQHPYSYESKKESTKQKKSTYYSTGASHSRKRFGSPAKKRLKASRSHSSQHSMLESLR